MENFIARNVPLHGWARTWREPVRWPLHDPASVPRRRHHGDLQHRAGARARGRGLDVDRLQGRARRARRRRARHSRRRRRRRTVRQRLRVPGAAVAGVGHVVVVRGSRRSCRPPLRSRAGMATKVLVLAGTAGVYVDRASTAPWTRPSSEFVAPFGMFTAAEFALVARRHMHMLRHQARRAGDGRGGDPQQRARATRTPIYHGRGPVHAAGHPRQPHGRRPVPPPRLRDRVGRRVRDGARRAPTSRPTLAQQAGVRPRGQRRQRRHRVQEPADVGARRPPPPRPRQRHRRPARRARTASAPPGSGPTDVDVCEFYDPFSFEIIRQFEAFGFCGEGEGGDFVTSGAIEPGGQYPVTTDGGVMSYSHAGASAQMLQRVIRGVEQLRGDVRDEPGRRVPKWRCAPTEGRGRCSPT